PQSWYAFVEAINNYYLYTLGSKEVLNDKNANIALKRRYTYLDNMLIKKFSDTKSDVKDLLYALIKEKSVNGISDLKSELVTLRDFKDYTNRPKNEELEKNRAYQRYKNFKDKYEEQLMNLLTYNPKIHKM